MPEEHARPSDPAPSWAVRLATVEDAEAIETVRITTWKACFRGIVSDEFLDGLDRHGVANPAISETNQGHQTRRIRRGVQRGVEIIGMGVGEPLDDSGPDAGVGEVHALYVLPGWQGRGVGRALLAGLTDALRARGYRAAVLWTLRDRPPTRRFYEANGWTFDGTETTYDWLGPVPLVRYTRDLSKPT